LPLNVHSAKTLVSPTTLFVMANADPIDPEYDPHLSAVDTRTANRLMALDPEERKLDPLGVPVVHLGFTGATNEGTPSTTPNGPGHDSTMQQRREISRNDEMRNVMDYKPGQDEMSM